MRGSIKSNARGPPQAGLLDLYENTANAQALSIVSKMADFVVGRVEHVIATRGWAWWETCLQVS